MKIFYKGDYQRVVGLYEILKEENDRLKKKINDKEFAYMEEYTKATKNCDKKQLELIKLQDNIKVLESKIVDLESKNKKSAYEKASATKTIHRLEKDVEYWKKQFEESMTDKYLIHKVPQGRKPRGQQMKTKSSVVQSNIITKVKEI